MEDELFELTENFDVNIIVTSHDNVNIGSMDTSNVNILDNDEVRVYFNDSTYTVLESDGEIEIGLNIELPSEGSSTTISVMATLSDVSTDGECKSPMHCKIGQSWFINICMVPSSIVLGLMDYTQSSFNVNLDIATNETFVSTSFIVLLENDDIPEAAEEFTITLTFDDPLVVFNGSAPVTILDDDGIMTIHKTPLITYNMDTQSYIFVLYSCVYVQLAYSHHTLLYIYIYSNTVYQSVYAHFLNLHSKFSTIIIYICISSLSST